MSAPGPTTAVVETSAGPAEVTLVLATLVPAGATGLLVLTHGSAGGVEAPDLQVLAGAATALGWDVAAVTQPFRLAGRRNPGRPAAQDAAWTEIVTPLHAAHPGPLVLAGRSNGARVACRTAGLLGAAGVVCLAFPVHPPGDPGRHRLAELDLPTCPVLVVQGDRDPFGVPRPRRGRRRVVTVVGADHSLRGADTAVARAARAFLRRAAVPGPDPGGAATGR